MGTDPNALMCVQYSKENTEDGDIVSGSESCTINIVSSGGTYATKPTYEDIRYKVPRVPATDTSNA